MAKSLSDRLGELRFELEASRQIGDPSLIWIGQLANVCAEYDIPDIPALEARVATWEIRP